MAKRKQKQKPRKRQAARVPEEKEDCKQRFIEQLAKGRAPGVAAHNANIARCTAYKWKGEDEEFNAAWIDAVETALDQIETDLYDEAHVKKNVVAMQYILRYRRKAVYGGGEDKQKETDSDERAKLEDSRIEDSRQILIQLGYLPPKIEGDYDKVDAAPAGNDADHS
jgi:hypothetical protein